MTKKEIIEHVFQNTSLTTSEAIQATSAVLNAIENALINHEDINFREFLSIKVVKTKNRTVYNFAKGKTEEYPGGYTPKIVMSAALKKKMNRKTK